MKDERLGSIRIANHNGRSRYRYKYNIRLFNSDKNFDVEQDGVARSHAEMILVGPISGLPTDSLPEDLSAYRVIDKDVDSLDLLKEELGKKQTKNVTLYELYTNSSLNNPVHEDINSQFSSYDIYDYKELNGLIDRLTSVVENIKYDSKNNIISGRHDFSEIKSLEEKKIISILENLNSELSNNNIEQLKEKFNSGLNKIDIEKIMKQ